MHYRRDRRAQVHGALMAACYDAFRAARQEKTLALTGRKCRADLTQGHREEIAFIG